MLDDLVRRFRERTLPKAEWTHAAHLSVGAWHVQHYGLTAAIDLLRTGIVALNESHGTANTESSGYHETITRAYAHLINNFLHDCEPGASLSDRVAVLLAGPLASGNILLEYYSRDLLMSGRARREWVPPDRKPLGWPSATPQ
jgi:hypothetical protein